MSKAHEKLKLNSGLIAALDCFAQPGPILSSDLSAKISNERLYIHRAQDRKGTGDEMWTVSMACGMARDILETEEIMRLKFLALRDGMKRYGMDGMYERIMGEPIDAEQP